MNIWMRMATAIGLAVVLQAPGPANSKELTGQERAELAGHALLGAPAPRLRLKTIDGRDIDLGTLYGKTAVYLEFWATWCVPCRQQMPHLEHTYETADPALTVIAINSGFNDSLEDVRTYRRKLNLHVPIVVDDGQAGAAFNLRVTPQHIVIGRDGRIQYVGHEADERLDAALKSAMAATLEGSQSEASSTPRALRHYRVSDYVPAISATTLQGVDIPLRDHEPMQTTVLVFLSPWCESYLASSRPARARQCRQVRLQVNSLSQKYPHVRWLGISSGLWATADDLSGYGVQTSTSIPLALDESGILFHTFEVTNVPTLLIVDRRGKISNRVEGYNARLEDVLERVGAE